MPAKASNIDISEAAGAIASNRTIQAARGILNFPDFKKLRASHKRFVLAYFETNLDAKKATIAAGFAENGVYRTAQRLLDTPGVARCIEEISQRIGQFLGYGAQEHVASLLALRDNAARAGQYGAAVTAESQIGKVLGLYIDRKEIDVTHRLSNEDLAAAVAREFNLDEKTVRANLTTKHRKKIKSSNNK